MKKLTTRLKNHALITLVFLIGMANNVMAMASRPNGDPNAPPPPGWVSWFPLIVMVFIFYFLLIRPQSKQRKERQMMLDNLQKGAKIVTQGGIHATIVNVGPNYFEVKINEDTKIRISKSAVADVNIEKPAEAKTPELVSSSK